MDSKHDKERDTAEHHNSDIETIDQLATFSHYQIRCPQFQATVIVQQLRSRGLSFQLWPAANAVCRYIETKFEGEGMCLPASMVDDRFVIRSDSGPVDDSLPRKLTTKSSERSAAGLVGATGGWLPSNSITTCNCLPTRRMRVIELGAGTGLVGIVAACLGGHVVLTDLPHVIPNVSYNLDMNKGAIQAAGGRAEVKVLRWGVEEDVQLLGDLSFDVILASDCVYDKTAYKPLLQTLKWLMVKNRGGAMLDDVSSKNKERLSVRPAAPTNNGILSGSSPRYPLNGEQTAPETKVAASRIIRNSSLLAEPGTGRESIQPVIFLGHLRRWKRDSHFFRMATKCFDVDVVYRHPSEENARVGPIVYRLTARNPSSVRQNSRTSCLSSSRSSSSFSSPRCPITVGSQHDSPRAF